MWKIGSPTLLYSRVKSSYDVLRDLHVDQRECKEVRCFVYQSGQKCVFLLFKPILDQLFNLSEVYEGLVGQLG